MLKKRQPKNYSPANREGWAFSGKRAHYYREGRSLCGKASLAAGTRLEQGKNDSPDNCAACAAHLGIDAARN